MRAIELSDMVLKQRDKWSCGPHALRHAFMTFGKVINLDLLIQSSGCTREEGVDEVGLKEAAQAVGYTLNDRNWTNHHMARKCIRACLAQRMPVLVCIDQWRHWVVITNMHKRKYVVVDSEKKGLLRLCDWKQLRKMIGYRVGPRKTLYDLLVLHRFDGDPTIAHVEFHPSGSFGV